ncbi:hypothetical protein LSTR_LSTR009589 [Laodelphax striatellus]|uniref:Uncharacterized protein n=1 Tax=Laodelphax striatellus TaxID=195883 RepID=A0A482WRA9_LAOST|nr:hypothetical protein LSTR_LSTR009589 [Laodelphax striatellus]
MKHPDSTEFHLQIGSPFLAIKPLGGCQPFRTAKAKTTKHRTGMLKIMVKKEQNPSASTTEQGRGKRSKRGRERKGAIDGESEVFNYEVSDGRMDGGAGIEEVDDDVEKIDVALPW